MVVSREAKFALSSPQAEYLRHGEHPTERREQPWKYQQAECDLLHSSAEDFILQKEVCVHVCTYTCVQVHTHAFVASRKQRDQEPAPNTQLKSSSC